MGKFKLISDYMPTGDQPKAIEKIVKNMKSGAPHQVLLGVTGSGKTFTMANVIERVQRPTLIISHNKTLAAQLFTEFKTLFPENEVHFFVSYYDYYQPEAYLPRPIPTSRKIPPSTKRSIAAPPRNKRPL